ncbi:MAG: DUF3501 family protein [Sandaracinaceae bacterium]|nr:DUF3501 family protein [Sandaracinaceae bacterium]
MRKLDLQEIRGPERYAAARDQARRDVIALKRARRVSVGPQVTLVFENRETMRFQIEEMCLVEGIVEPDKIQHEVDTYNAILPEEGALGATLFVEVMSEKALRNVLDKLVGLHEHVWLVVAGERVKAAFDPDQFTTDKLAAVQYLKLPLTAPARAALARPGTELKLAIDHEAYRHETTLSEETRAELARDLES